MNDNSLNIRGGINPEGLRRGDYLASLLEQARAAGLISAEETDGIKIQCIKLLGQFAEHYTSGESSSIPEAAADMLLKSILYTVGISIKAYPSPEAALSALLEKGIERVYSDGRVRIRKLLDDAKKAYSSLCASLVPVENRTYKETVLQGIKGFFKKYDPVFAAHDTVITADYPTASDLTGLTGIEFISEYLNALDAENRFLARFSPADISRLLKNIDEEFYELVTGIYMHVLVQALGCVAVGKDPLKLRFAADDIAILKNKLRNKSAGGMESTITSLYDSWLSDNSDNTGHSEAYVRNTLKKAAEEIHAAVSGGFPQRVFTEIRMETNSGKQLYDMGVRMDDKKYRALLGRISSCRHWTEKTSLIAREVASLADFGDLLRDAELSGEEAQHVLKLLKPEDIAALCVKLGVLDEVPPEYGRNEDVTAKRLEKYLMSLMEGERCAIKAMVDKMEVILGGIHDSFGHIKTISMKSH